MSRRGFLGMLAASGFVPLESRIEVAPLGVDGGLYSRHAVRGRLRFCGSAGAARCWAIEQSIRAGARPGFLAGAIVVTEGVGDAAGRWLEWTQEFREVVPRLRVLPTPKQLGA